MPFAPSSFLLLVVRPGAPSSSLLLVAMPGASTERTQTRLLNQQSQDGVPNLKDRGAHDPLTGWDEKAPLL